MHAKFGLVPTAVSKILSYVAVVLMFQTYEEGELLKPPTPLPVRAHSAQCGVPSPGVRGSYSRDGEDNGTHSYVVSCLVT